MQQALGPLAGWVAGDQHTQWMREQDQARQLGLADLVAKQLANQFSQETMGSRVAQQALQPEQTSANIESTRESTRAQKQKNDVSEKLGTDFYVDEAQQQADENKRKAFEGASKTLSELSVYAKDPTSFSSLASQAKIPQPLVDNVLKNWDSKTPFNKYLDNYADSLMRSSQAFRQSSALETQKSTNKLQEIAAQGTEQRKTMEARNEAIRSRIVANVKSLSQAIEMEKNPASKLTLVSQMISNLELALDATDDVNAKLEIKKQIDFYTKVGQEAAQLANQARSDPAAGKVEVPGINRTPQSSYSLPNGSMASPNPSNVVTSRKDRQLAPNEVIKQKASGRLIVYDKYTKKPIREIK